jgi:cytoskeletal protein RodZ
MEHGTASSNELQRIGQLLQEARQARGLSIAQVEAETLIRSKYLEALEQGRAEVLPAEVYLHGMLKTFGNQVGLDGQQLVERYKLAKRVNSISESSPPVGRRRFVWIDTCSAMLRW